MRKVALIAVLKFFKKNSCELNPLIKMAIIHGQKKLARGKGSLCNNQFHVGKKSSSCFTLQMTWTKLGDCILSGG
jgi:hypothetical protein